MQACTGLQKFLPVVICQGEPCFYWFEQELLVLIRADSFLQDVAPWKSCPSSEVSELISYTGRKGKWIRFPKDLKPCQDFFRTERAKIKRLLCSWLLFVEDQIRSALYLLMHFSYPFPFDTTDFFKTHTVATIRLLCITISKGKESERTLRFILTAQGQRS